MKKDLAWTAVDIIVVSFCFVVFVFGALYGVDHPLKGKALFCLSPMLLMVYYWFICKKDKRDELSSYIATSVIIRYVCLCIFLLDLHSSSQPSIILFGLPLAFSVRDAHRLRTGELVSS